MKISKTLILPALLWLAGMALGGCESDFALRRVAPPPDATAENISANSATATERHWATASGQAFRLLASNRAGDDPPAMAQARRKAAETLIDQYGPALLRDPRHSLLVPLSEGRLVRLRLRRGAGEGGMPPDEFLSLEPTDHFVVKTKAKIVHVPGVGAPLVGILHPRTPVSVAGVTETTAMPGLDWAVTAVPVLRGAANGHPADGAETLDFDLYDPHLTERVQETAHESGALAADYTTPIAVAVAHFKGQRRGLRGFLNGSDVLKSAGIYTYETPCVDKIPLVLVHGLISDPTSFHLLLDNLESDREVRRCYQVWFFYYPSSLSVPYSAMLLREDLEKFIHQLDPDGTHPALHHAVLVGHSMGGMLTRLAVSEGGDPYYHHFFRQPLDQLHLTADQRDLMRRAFYYHACPDVDQVVFIATPHRGSKLADGLLGHIGQLLVRVPVAARTRIGDILTNNRTAIVPGTPIKPASSINSLTPRDPVIAAINDMPMRPGLGVHSIIGNRGRNGPLEQSSDGIVPYTSSHLAKAQSEIVVPAGHTGTLARQETATEIIRILHQAGP